MVVDGSVGAKANLSPAETTATASSGVASVSGTAESAVSGGVGIMVRSEIGAVVAVALVIQLVEPLHVLI